MTTYKGFSTYNRMRKFTLTDFDLIKQDLFNHFSIRKGEKLMNPKFGTIIWGLLFEPMSPEIKALVSQDVKEIIDYDPRISADRISVTEFEHGIQINLNIRYVLTNQTGTMALKFSRASNQLTYS